MDIVHATKDDKNFGKLLISACLYPKKMGIVDSEEKCFYVMEPEEYQGLHKNAFDIKNVKTKLPKWNVTAKNQGYGVNYANLYNTMQEESDKCERIQNKKKGLPDDTELVRADKFKKEFSRMGKLNCALMVQNPDLTPAALMDVSKNFITSRKIERPYNYDTQYKALL